MTRSELEHLIRAAGAIADVNEIVVLGAILGQFPDEAESPSTDEDRQIIFRSAEADIMVMGSEEKTALIEGAIGELSLFHTTFGYYAQGVDISTSRLPEGWKDRLITVCSERTQGISGLCLEVHDLMISKLYAGRKKDIEFFGAAVHLCLISRDTLQERLRATIMPDERRRLVEGRIEKGFSP